MKLRFGLNLNLKIDSSHIGTMSIMLIELMTQYLSRLAQSGMELGSRLQICQMITGMIRLLLSYSDSKKKRTRTFLW